MQRFVRVFWRLLSTRLGSKRYWAPVFGAALLLGWAQAATAQASHSELNAVKTRLQQALDAQRLAQHYPGATFAFVLADGTEFATATGSTDVQSHSDMRPDARMLSGSIGKTFVATLMLQLVEEQKARLDDKLERYLGDRPWFARLPNAREITLASLLGHLSGLEDHVDLPTFQQDVRRFPGKSRSHDELIAYVLDRPALGAVGTHYRYSDTNYLLLGMVIERITARDYYGEIERRYLKPLKLNRTMPSNRSQLPGLVDAYTNADNPFGLPQRVTQGGRDVLNPQIEWTGGGLVSNSLDIARWAHLLYGGQVLQAGSLRSMLETRTTIGPQAWYGLGVYEWQTELGTVYGHQGEFPGYWSVMEYFKDFDLAIGMQFNTDDLRMLGNPPRLPAQSLAKIIIEGMSANRSP